MDEVTQPMEPETLEQEATTTPTASAPLIPSMESVADPSLPEAAPVADDGAVAGPISSAAPEASVDAIGTSAASAAPPWTGVRARYQTRRPPHWRRWIVALVCVVLLIALLVPLSLTLANGLRDYSELRALGLSGMHHLLAAKDDLLGRSAQGTTGSSASCSTGAATATSRPAAIPTPSPTSVTSLAATLSVPSPTTLEHARVELLAAQSDFGAVRARLARPDVPLSTAAHVPSLDAKITSADALAAIGADTASAGLALIDAALPALTRIHDHALAGGPLLTTADVAGLQRALQVTVTLLDDVQQRLPRINLADLPLCASQKTLFAALAAEIPQARHALSISGGLLTSVSWALGVDAPRHLLVQTLDRAELRPSGGFAGEYGVVTIQNGSIAPFTLNNVDLLDYGHYSNGWAINNRPPAAYSWWPVANWGLRDANLSGDFPTNAHLVLDAFAHEGGGTMDGLVNVTPVAIAHVLDVTGPLVVPVYNETVTGANLEERIHYYQLTPAGQARNAELYPQDTPAFARKRFAQLIAHTLEQRLRALPLSALLPVARQVFTDLRAKEIQVYVTQPDIEGLLSREQSAGAVDTTPWVDGFFVVQTNWGAAKSTPHIFVIQHDDITLDTAGGATHSFTLSLENKQDATPYYGPTTYQDYVRIYAPSNATLLQANGFDTPKPLCQPFVPPPVVPPTPTPTPTPSPTPGPTPTPTPTPAPTPTPTPTPTPMPTPPPPSEPPLPTCAAQPYPDGELTCPAGDYVPGDRTYTLHGNDHARPLDVLGGPSETQSDIAGRAMWGGNVVVPIGCTATVTLMWHVSDVAAPSAAVPADAPLYSVLVQRQSGTFYDVSLTVHPATAGAAAQHFSALLDQNRRFTLPRPGKTRAR